MRRAFDSLLEVREDGREVYGRMVPIGVRAHVRETVEDGTIDEYDEEFLPGCTERMRQVAKRRGGAPAWIRFTLDHESQMDARLGFCSAMTESDDGAYGTFRLYDGPHLAKARSMLAESHTGLSIEFADVAPPRVTGDLRQRRQINIAAVTATPIPVYADAQILALRSDAVPELVGTPNLDAVAAMLADLGVLASGDAAT
jgi:hypothetical protein